MSMSLDDVKRALNNIAQNKDLPGANILGINVEGPFICKNIVELKILKILLRRQKKI